MKYLFRLRHKIYGEEMTHPKASCQYEDERKIK